VYANAYAERFVKTIKESCLERMILFGEDSLRNAVREFVEHYHLERNHQGLGNALIVPIKTTHETIGAMPSTIGRTAELLLPASSIKTAKVVDCGTNLGHISRAARKCNRNLRPRLARL
jgi:Integrase core domain